MALRRKGNLGTFADTLHGAHLGAILHGVNGEVDLGQWPLVLDGANGIVNLLGVEGAGRAGTIVAFHVSGNHG